MSSRNTANTLRVSRRAGNSATYAPPTTTNSSGSNGRADLDLARPNWNVAARERPVRRPREKRIGPLGARHSPAGRPANRTVLITPDRSLGPLANRYRGKPTQRLIRHPAQARPATHQSADPCPEGYPGKARPRRQLHDAATGWPILITHQLGHRCQRRLDPLRGPCGRRRGFRAALRLPVRAASSVRFATLSLA